MIHFVYHTKVVKNCIIKSFDKNDTRKKISNAMRKADHWNYYDELYELWVYNNHPKFKKFKTIAVNLGYPQGNYQGIVNVFTKNKESINKLISESKE